MKFINIILCLFIIGFTSNPLIAQQDCTIEDPLINFDYSLYIDPGDCCEEIIGQTHDISYDFTPANQSGCFLPFRLFEFNHPAGTWTGNILFTSYSELANTLNSILSNYNINDVFEALPDGVQSIAAESPNYGSIIIREGSNLKEKENKSRSSVSNCYHVIDPDIETWDLTQPCTDVITPPTISLDDVGPNAPTPSDEIIMDIPNDPNEEFTTSDITQSGVFNESAYTGPSANAVGNLLNAVAATGVIQNGIGCQNINCYDLSGLAAQLNTGEMATEINSNISEPVPDQGNSWSEYLSQEVGAALEEINLAELLNESFGLNIPNVECNELISLPLDGGSSNEVKNRNGSRNPLMNAETEADANFFNKALPGAGVDGVGEGLPSPNALEIIKDIKGGVNLYNGSQNTSIPLYNLQANDLGLPISLNSSNNGLKVNDMGTTSGQHWNLQAGGSISRVVKGLPDEFEGTTHGTGAGMIYELTPLFEFPSSIGLDVKITGLGNFACLPLPTKPAIKQKIKVGFEEDLVNTGAVKVVLSWTPLKGNRISFVLHVTVVSTPFVSVAVKTGFDIGFNISQVLGNIDYEQKGLGYNYLTDAGKMEEFDLSPLTSPKLSDLGEDEQRKLLNKAHSSKWFEDLKFFNEQIDNWDNWIDAITGNHEHKTEILDLEPDVYHFNVGGYEGRFSYNLNGSVVIFPYQEGLTIEREINGGHISKFTIHTPDGNTYVLGSSNLNAVDMTENVNYNLPTFITYPEIGSDRDEFGAAKIDVNQLSYHPFVGKRLINIYGNTYERNYKRMEMPRFSSTWHLTQIHSKSSLETIDLEYVKREGLTYYSDKSFNHTLPDFDIKSNGNFSTESNNELNWPHWQSTRWENGRAEFTYNATETTLDRWDLKSIETSRKEHVLFEYISGDGAIAGDFLLDKVKVLRGGNTPESNSSQLFKGWKFSYGVEAAEGGGTSICNENTNTVQGVLTVMPGDTKFDLGQSYQLNHYEYNNYLNIDVSLGCLKVPFRINIGFLADVLDWGYTEELGMYGSLMDVKRRLNIFDQTKEEDIYNAEHKRVFLENIQIIDKDGTHHNDFIETFYNEGDLPKRYSIDQDLFGYYNRNVNGSPLPPLEYTAYNGRKINSQISGVDKHFPFSNQMSQGNMHLGQIIEANEERVQFKALKSLKYGSGGEIIYDYQMNTIPYKETVINGGGLVVSSLTENPFDMPAKITNYTYQNGIVITDPIRIHKNPDNYYYPQLEERVVCSSSFMNELFSNRSNHVGYGQVTESWENNGKIEHYFTTPKDFMSRIGASSNIIDDGKFQEFRKGINNTEFEYYPGNANLPPELVHPTEMVQISKFFGLEYLSEVYNEDGLLIQQTDNTYDYYGTICNCYFIGNDEEKLATRNNSQSTPCAPSLTYFKTNRYQYNHPGSFWQRYTYRLVENFLPFYSTTPDTENLIDFLIDLICSGIGSLDHPFKYIDRNFHVSERCIKSGNVRLSESITQNFFEDNTSNSSSTSYSYTGTLPNIATLVSQITSDNHIIISHTYFKESNAPGLSYFSPEALNQLVTIQYNMPLYAETFQDGELINHDLTSLRVNNNRLVPWASYTSRNGSPALHGVYDEYDTNGKPQNFYLAKLDGDQYATLTNEDLFFKPIELTFNDQLQLTERTYGDFTTNYEYDDTYFVLKKVTDPDLIESTYDYDSRWRLFESSSMNGKHSTKYIYNIGEGENTLQTILSFEDGFFEDQISTQKIDGFGRPISLTRDNDGAIISSTSYDGMFRVNMQYQIGSGGTSITYDNAPINRKQTTIDAEGNETITIQTGDETHFAKSETIDANGHPITLFLDGLGRTEERISGEGGITKYTYDGLNRVKQITNPEDENYNYDYSSDLGQLYSKKIPGAVAKTTWWDKAYRPIAMSDGLSTQIIQYDDYNRITGIYLATEGAPLGDANITVDEGAFDGFIDLPLQENQYETDHTWLEQSSTGILGGSNIIGYKSTTLTRDGLGRILNESVNYPVGSVNTTLGITDAGLNTHEDIIVTGPDGTANTYTNLYDYDDILRLTKTRLDFENLGPVLINKLFYNGFDQVTKKYVGGSEFEPLQKVDYAYDAIGRLVQINSPAESECFQDLTTCDFEANIAIDVYDPNQCRYLTEIQVNGISYPLGAVLDLYQSSDQLVTALQEALTTAGLFGEVSADVEITGESSIVINLLVLSSNAQDIQLIFTNCRGYAIALNPTNCCTNENSENNDQDGLSPEYVDLFYESIEYTGLDISQIDMALACEAGFMRNQYKYDADHRVTEVMNTFYNPDPIQDAYSTSYQYLPAGSIKKLTRRGLIEDTPAGQVFGMIDELIYDYNAEHLTTVTDHVSQPLAQPKGFKPQVSDYSYDANGNMTEDLGKQLGITYNLLNLPATVFSLANNDNLSTEYCYSGEKIRKQSTVEGTTEDRRYYGGFEFVNGEVEFLSHAEGRVLVRSDKPAYQFRLTDHLGNTVVAFEDYNEDGIISTEIPANFAKREVRQKNYSYAFGLQMEGVWNDLDDPRMDYLYNGKELNEEFGLDWLDYGARWYDPAIARWGQVDPHAENYYSASPYSYVLNNPLIYIDPDGRDVVNGYEKYAKYKEKVETLESNLAEAKTIRGKKGRKARKKAKKELRKNSDIVNGVRNYKTVKKLINDFKTANKDEFDIVDNLEFGGSEINVKVSLSSTLKEDGKTNYSYAGQQIVQNADGSNKRILPTDIKNNQIAIEIKDVTLGTIANEFGDAIFAVENSEKSYNDSRNNVSYYKKGSTHFSFDYENYIIGKINIRPNPKDY